jgi:hypothetical protein
MKQIAELSMRRACKIIGAVFAMALVAAPMAAAAHVSFDVNIAPVALRYKPVPASRPGYFRAPDIGIELAAHGPGGPDAGWRSKLLI